MPAKKPFYALQIPSSLDGLAGIISGALNALQEQGWIEDANNFCARLCLEEALVNAITHGNEGDERRRVRLEMWEEGDRCRIRVFDEGHGFNTEDVPFPTKDQPRGRGLCLIKHFMDHVEFDAGRRCLEMTFSKNRLTAKR